MLGIKDLAVPSEMLLVDADCEVTMGEKSSIRNDSTRSLRRSRVQTLFISKLWYIICTKISCTDCTLVPVNITMAQIISFVVNCKFSPDFDRLRPLEILLFCCYVSMILYVNESRQLLQDISHLNSCVCLLAG